MILHHCSLLIPKPFSISLLTLAVSCLACQQLRAELQPTHLRCEYLTNPLGIDEPAPRLTWVLSSGERGARQSAYQILVASSPDRLAADEGDLWDSGQVASDETAHIPYAGARLRSTQQVWWKVRVWDADKQASSWSEPARWEMGLLEPSDWHGKWIALNERTDEQPLPLFRRELKLDRSIKRARVYVTGLGYFELRINGEKIGDHRLDPGYTRYDKRVLYLTHDVTDALRQGENAIGVMLGNGWFNVQTKAAWEFDSAPWRASPRLLMELRVEYEDGTTEILSTDETWRASPGPIVFNSIYGGETYDARLEQPGWDNAGFDDGSWQAAQVVPAPEGKLVSQAMHAIEVTKKVVPKSVTEVKPGVFVFDVGQNLAGNARLTISGPAGTQMKMKYGELLHEDGTVNQDNIAVHIKRFGAEQQFQTDTYILRGQRTESWESRFNYNGFRYVEVTGAPEPLTVDNLRIQFLHSAVPEVGTFRCSNELLNKIWEATRWAYLSNLHGIPTDCPHREKNGWMADAHLSCELALWNYDAVTVYEKWLEDMADEQKEDGRLPGIVPTGGWGYAWGNGPAWDSAFLLIPEYLHLYYGDPRTRIQHYAQHLRYVDYLVKEAGTGVNGIGLGDWCPAKTSTPEVVTSTVYHVIDARIVAETARLLGKREDAEKYGDIADAVRDSFNSELYDPETGKISVGSQTAQVFPLYYDMIPPAEAPKVFDVLLADIRAKSDHLDTGVLGARALLHTLTDRGQVELAYRIATQTTEPSWGAWLAQGATTLWEAWDGSGSHNHIFFGDCINWYVRSLVGINPDPAAPGFKHILVKPHPVGGLTFAEASYDSIRGPIHCRWDREGETLRLKLEIPAGTTATLFLPTSNAESIRESERPLADAPHVQLIKTESGVAEISVDSGAYEFITEFGP